MIDNISLAVFSLNETTGHNFTFKKQTSNVYIYPEYVLLSDGEPLKAEGLLEKDFLLFLKGVATGVLIEMIKRDTINSKEEGSNEEQKD